MGRHRNESEVGLDPVLERSVYGSQALGVITRAILEICPDVIERLLRHQSLLAALGGQTAEVRFLDFEIGLAGRTG
jgi:hypothetical protein